MSANAGLDWHTRLLELLPNLRAFANSLCRDADYADDLVQQTLLKAWKSRYSFHEGSNLKAWLFAILRNTFLTELRKRKYEAEDPDDELQHSLISRGGQQAHMDMLDFELALSKLPQEQREVLILVGAEGVSYDEAALICGCAIGTIKSRMSRARERLCELMGVGGAADFGPDKSDLGQNTVATS
jgi:RNA polymerase sigma-70 factor (ECF subfamily)